MIRESCIKHPARNPTVVLRADYLCLCDGDHCAAMILSQHEHWHNVRLENLQQAREHNKAAVRGSEQPTQDVELWVYQAQLAMKGQLMGLFGDKAITTGYKTILDKGFLQKRTNPRFTWDKTLQYLFMVDRVQAAVDALPPLPDEDEAAQDDESAELRGSRAQKCALDAAEMQSPERKDADPRTHKCATPKTSSETSSETLPPPEVPPAPVQEEDEAALDVSEQETASQKARVGAMLDKLVAVTGTRIEIEALRPLALECAGMEHKDAWAHTLNVLKAKMVCDKKLLNPNRYAATVLAKALESPVPPAKVRETKQPAPAPAQDAPALWAMREARRELSGSGATAFKRKHGRHSVLADWEARAREIEAEAVKDN